MMQALGGQGIAQGLHHMLLPDHFGEIPGPVFAGKHKIGHQPILRADVHRLSQSRN
jgi:hypothetical protein